MVPDALQIFCNHQQVDTHLTAIPLSQQADQFLLHIQKELVHLVIPADHGLGQAQVFPYKGVYAVGDHDDGVPGHLSDGHPADHGAVGDVQGDLRNVRCLVADALHVGDHLQRGRDGAQIPSHRLLLEQQLHAQVLDVPLFLIDLPLGGGRALPQGVISVQQGLGGGGDGLLTQGPHFDQFHIQLLQLLIESVPHYPNLPVM